jgi:LacI family transcriptional regulator
MRRVTRDDVARRAGTSAAVVSYVVNNGPRGVAAATRQRVEDAMAELGYRPNLIARALAANQTNTIGLIVPDISNAWFSLLAHRVEESACARGLVLLLGSSRHSAEREVQQLRTLSNLRVDGAILAQSPLVDPDLGGLRLDVPLVYMNRSAPADSPHPSVLVDDVGGARLAVRHLLGHGHTEIACLTGPADAGPLADRAAGWRQELRSAGLDPSDDLLLRSGFGHLDAYDFALRWIGQTHRAAALFCASDELAVGVLRAAAQVGARIPDDLAVVGFDDIIEARTSHPGLTTVHQPVDELATTAVDTLIKLRDTGEPQSDRTLAVELVIRGSCGC